MKSPFVLLSFLFLAFTSKPLLRAQADPEPLLDINGETVLAGTPYYIMPAFWGPVGGGLNLFKGRNVCPLDVIQENSDLNKGKPLILSPAVENEDGIVYESTDLNIKFSNSSTICPQSTTVWEVANYDKSTGQWFITTDGVEGNPGAQTLLNWFKFERTGGTLQAYRIVHCPKVCDTCVTLCSDIGIHWMNGRRYLALKIDPGLFMVHFIKADEVNLLHANKKIIRMMQ